MIYVTVMSCGCYEDYISINAYAGSSLEMAYAAAENFIFSDYCSQWGYIQYWQDGVMVKDIPVREFDQMFPIVS